MFGSRNPRPTPPRQHPSQQPAPGPYSRIPPAGSDRYGAPPSYGRPSSGNERPFYDGPPPEKQEYSRGYSEPRRGGGGEARPGTTGQTWQLKPAKSPGNQFIFGNLYRSLDHVLSRRAVTDAPPESLSRLSTFFLHVMALTSIFY